MKRFLRGLFGKGNRRGVIEVPAVCGRRLSLSEVQAALGNRQSDVMMQSVLWLIVLRRGMTVDAAQKDAHRRQDASFQLGAKQALDDLLADVTGFMEGKPDDEAKSFFSGD